MTTKFFAPYLDTTVWPPFEVHKFIQQKYYTLAFIIADEEDQCQASWGGYYNLHTTEPSWFADQIQFIRNNGGDVIISLGGPNGLELASVITDHLELVKEYQFIIDMYKVKILDFYIEGASIPDLESIERRNKALVVIKLKNPSIKIHYTLPVMPYGLVHAGYQLILNCVKCNLHIDLINLLCMDYGQKTDDMGQAAISAVRNVKKQLIVVGYPEVNLGITPMIGVNTISSEIFTLNNARTIMNFCKNTDYISMLSMWSVDRDSSQATFNFVPAFKKSGIIQGNYEFCKIFNEIMSYNKPTLYKPVPLPNTPAPKMPLPKVPDGFWEKDKKYDVNSKVIYKGIKYTCLVPHSSIHAPGINIWEVSTDISVWQVGIKYSLNDVVIYNGKKYKCVSPNQSIQNWAPGPFTQGLWSLL